MIMNMRKESGEITTDREEILKICANFYKSLYTQTVPTPESTMKSSPDTEEIPEFTEEEVERAIKRMKRQSPGSRRNHKSYYKTRGTDCPHLLNKHLQQHTKDKADS